MSSESSPSTTTSAPRAIVAGHGEFAAGLVSAVHGPDEVARTLDAFRVSVRWMKAEGDIAA